MKEKHDIYLIHHNFFCYNFIKICLIFRDVTYLRRLPSNSTRIFNFTTAIATELARHTTFAGRSRFRSTVAGRRRTRSRLKRARGYRRDPGPDRERSGGYDVASSCTATRKRRFFRFDEVRCSVSLKGNARSAGVRMDGC